MSLAVVLLQKSRTAPIIGLAQISDFALVTVLDGSVLLSLLGMGMGGLSGSVSLFGSAAWLCLRFLPPGPSVSSLAVRRFLLDFLPPD